MLSEITSYQEYSHQDEDLCKLACSCVRTCIYKQAFTALRHSLHCNSSHLQLGKLLSLVAGVLGIDELGEEELMELEALRKGNAETERRRERRFTMTACKG